MKLWSYFIKKLYYNNISVASVSAAGISEADYTNTIGGLLESAAFLAPSAPMIRLLISVSIV